MSFAKFLDLGHRYGVSVMPIYDSGPNAAELIAEAGAIYHLIKGPFHQRLEALLPPEIPVEVIRTKPAENLQQN